MTRVKDDPKQVHREVVRGWLRRALTASGRSAKRLSVNMGKGDAWVSNRINRHSTLTPNLDELHAIARVLKYPLTDDVRKALVDLESMPRTRVTRRSAPPETPDQGSPVATEMVGLLQLAVHVCGAAGGDKNVERMRRRFGLTTGLGQTLQEVADQEGITRERIRQIESRIFEVLAEMGAELPSPILDQVHARALEMMGHPESTVQATLGELLGDVPLMEALRFYQAIKPRPASIGRDTAAVYGRERLNIVAVKDGVDTRFVEMVSQCARRLHAYAGACLLSDLRSFVETRLKRKVPIESLIATVSALPGAYWLGGGQRWFHFQEDATTPMLARVANIVAFARRPVEFETIYGGLLCGVRADRKSEAAGFTDPLPPPFVILEILDNHPAFVRRVATSFALTEPMVDQLSDVETDHRALLLAIDRNGGVLAKGDLVRVTRADGSAISKHSIGATLYNSSYIVRSGPAVYAIRGRDLDPQLLLDTQKRAASLSSATLVRPQPTDGVFEADIPLSEQLKRARIVYLRKMDIPANVAGSYRLSDGHEIILHDDVHGVRLSALGKHIIGIISREVGIMRLRFDNEKRTVHVNVRATA